MPHKDGENTESVMLSYYPEVNEKYEDKELEAKWDKILKIKEAVAKKLEEARAEKVIGHSLNATDNWLAGWTNFDPQNAKY